MPATFKLGDEEIETFLKEIEGDVIDYLLGLYQALTTETPVDTGYARANWLIDFGSFVSRTVGTRPNVPGRKPRSGALIQAPSADKIETWTVEAGNVIFHNSVEYIEYLEDGSSAQADQGIVQPALAAAEARFG